MQAPEGLRGLLFDKDGTLFDFQATWGVWGGAFIRELAGGEEDRAQALATALGYDLAKGRFAPTSPVVAGTMEVVIGAVMATMPTLDEALLRRQVLESTAAAPQVPAASLRPLLGRLRETGYRLGVATNDAEGPARAHLERAGVLADFDFIAGYDSGHGAKPGSGMALEFCRVTGLPPAACAMIGDSAHDLASGRAAGMFAVGVLTGPAGRDDLVRHADLILPGIAALPDWLGLTALEAP
jgi:phosphoglycolate phosphatase